MTSDDLVKAIRSLKPSAEFSFENADYSSIEWHSLEGDAPTLAEVEIAHKNIKKNEAETLAELQAKKAALLDRLGINENEFRLLLS